jgi:hypothetical protein
MMMSIGMRRPPALTASVSKVDPAASTRDDKTVQLVCLSLALAVAVLGLRIASVL